MPLEWLPSGAVRQEARIPTCREPEQIELVRRGRRARRALQRGARHRGLRSRASASCSGTSRSTRASPTSPSRPTASRPSSRCPAEGTGFVGIVDLETFAVEVAPRQRPSRRASASRPTAATALVLSDRAKVAWVICGERAARPLPAVQGADRRGRAQVPLVQDVARRPQGPDAARSRARRSSSPPRCSTVLAVLVSGRESPVGEAPPLTPLGPDDAPTARRAARLGPGAIGPEIEPEPEPRRSIPTKPWRAREIQIGDVHPLDIGWSPSGRVDLRQRRRRHAARVPASRTGELVHQASVPGAGRPDPPALRPLRRRAPARGRRAHPGDGHDRLGSRSRAARRRPEPRRHRRDARRPHGRRRLDRRQARHALRSADRHAPRRHHAAARDRPALPRARREAPVRRRDGRAHARRAAGGRLDRPLRSERGALRRDAPQHLGRPRAARRRGHRATAARCSSRTACRTRPCCSRSRARPRPNRCPSARAPRPGSSWTTIATASRINSTARTASVVRLSTTMKVASTLMLERRALLGRGLAGRPHALRLARRHRGARRRAAASRHRRRPAQGRRDRCRRARARAPSRSRATARAPRSRRTTTSPSRSSSNRRRS